MSTINKRNFTTFQNVQVLGTNFAPAEIKFVTGSGPGTTPGSTTWDTTIAIVPAGGASVGAVTTTNEVPYLNIASAGLSIGTGYIRFTPFGGSNAGTISVNTSYNDTDRAWILPSKSGTFGITGTFSVDLPAITANNYLSTLVTVTGLRVEDGIVITPQSVTAASLLSARAPVAISNAVPGNGNVTIVFQNYWATATIPTTGIFAYTAVR